MVWSFFQLILTLLWFSRHKELRSSSLVPSLGGDPEQSTLPRFAKVAGHKTPSATHLMVIWLVPLLGATVGFELLAPGSTAKYSNPLSCISLANSIFYVYSDTWKYHIFHGTMQVHKLDNCYMGEWPIYTPTVKIPHVQFHHQNAKTFLYRNYLIVLLLP